MPNLESDRKIATRRDEYGSKSSNRTENNRNLARLMSSSDMERRRSVKWLSFMRPKIPLGFDRLVPSDLPHMVSRASGIAISFDRIDGWSMPPPMQREVETHGYELKAQLSMSLLHLKSSTFYGSTWMGTQIPLLDDSSRIPERLDMEYGEIVYMVSRIKDPQCVAVVEIVVSKIDPERKVVVGQYGCGWTVLSLMGKDSLQIPDIADGYESILPQTTKFYMGSPRDLITSGGDMSLVLPQLKEMKGCTLTYYFCMHRKLLRAQRLIAENEIIGRYDIVPGLNIKEVTPPLQSNTYKKECIGDVNVQDGKRGIRTVPVKPVINTPMSLKIVDFQILLPERKYLESRVITQVTKMISDIDPGLVHITARTLKIGLHNGHTVLGGDWQIYNLDTDEEDDVLRTSARSITLNGFVAHELMALAMVIEFDVAIPVGGDDPDTSAAVAQLQQSQIRQGNIVTPVCMGASIFLPSDGKKMFLRNTSGADDELGLELSISGEGVGGALTSSVVFKDSGGEGSDAGTTEDGIMGFTLKAYDSVSGELRHGDDAPAAVPAGGVIPDIPDSDSSIAGTDVTPRRDVRVTESEFNPRLHRDRSTTAKDDDLDSLQGSIIEGDSVVSSLRLDPTFYSSKPRREERVMDNYDNDVDPLFVNNKSSLLARTLNAKLDSGMTAAGTLGASHARGALRETTSGFGPLGGPSVATMNMTSGMDDVGASDVTYRSDNKTHARDISRGVRSRLARHGFDDAMKESNYNDASGQGKGKGPDGIRERLIQKSSGIVDLDIEVEDELNCNDITLQFAGYRAGPLMDKTTTTGGADLFRRPKTIYLSYQFFSCPPTRTESMRLLPAPAGDVSVLAREEARTRDETPLMLRYVIDCSTGSPTESFEFAEYLAKSNLCVEVWDADASLLLGMAILPLRRLMRQGQQSAKCAVECDVIDVECGAQIHGGVTSTVLSESGYPSGVVVGSLHVILSNYGLEGKAGRTSMLTADTKDVAGGMGNPSAALNWRAMGNNMHSNPRGTGKENKKRAKTLVRARPLSDTAPELSRALEEYRNSSKGTSMRSLALGSNGASGHTLDYDEVLTLFKRFGGNDTGTVQYSGDLMRLLDIPSWPVVTRKVIKAYKRASERGRDVEAELTRRTGSSGLVNPQDVNEFFEQLQESVGLHAKTEECLIIAANLTREGVDLTPRRIVAFILKEIESQQWVLVGKKLRQASQKAVLLGLDVEQMLSDRDTNGDGYLSTVEFKEFLDELSSQVRLTSKEQTMIVKHFTRRPPQGDKYQDPIPVRDVLAFLGKEYVGNLNVRLARCLRGLRGENRSAEDISAHFRKVETARRGVFSHNELEDNLANFGVYETMGHDQVKSVLVKADKHKSGSITIDDFLSFLGIKSADEGETMDAEQMLRRLVEKAQRIGADIDTTFRHFDVNGDGTLTQTELEEGLAKLKIFDGIPKWKKQIPGLIKKFDKDGDGTIQLKEFLTHLGIHNYEPNLIQHLTRICIKSREDLSIDEIFSELDAQNKGELSAADLRQGLAEKLNKTVSVEDCTKAISTITHDRTTVVKQSEFVEYFTNTVNKSIDDTIRKAIDKFAHKVRHTLQSSQNKTGQPVAKVFPAYVKDASLSVTVEEFCAGIRKVSGLESVSDSELQGFIALILGGRVPKSFRVKELVAWLSASEDEIESASAPKSDLEKLADKIRAIFRTAEENGTSADAIFRHFDTEGHGKLLTDDFLRALRRIKSFENLSLDEARMLTVALDADDSGDISMDEFRNFVQKGVAKNRVGVLKPGGKVALEPIELLQRHLTRIAEPDGGIDGLIAFLDNDEDGLISLSSFLRVLRREGVLDDMGEDQILALLQPSRRGENLNVVSLLRLLEGAKAGADAEDEDPLIEDPPYEFSRDPVFHSLEKKLRGVGRVLARRGVDVEGLFRSADARNCGMIRRSDFIEVMSKMGLYILERGKAVDNEADDDTRHSQLRQVSKFGNKNFGDKAAVAAKRLFGNEAKSGGGDFQEHLESMALVNWYRQGQKQMLLQRVLSHSLGEEIQIYPRFGKTLFFEYPVANPFAHEERFIIEVNDPELRVVTNFEEWSLLRQKNRPCVGKIGEDPVEADMFDQDALGNVQIALLANETLHIPFTFMTLVPYTPPERKGANRAQSKEESKENGISNDIPKRTVEVRIISGSHGHVVSVLKVQVHPRPYIVNSTFRFFEQENTIMKRRIRLKDLSSYAALGRGGGSGASSKFIHCVDGQVDNKVVVEWGPSNSGSNFDSDALDVLLRYRCMGYPSSGSFFILVYNDPFQSSLDQIWQVIVQTRQKLDIHSAVGGSAQLDLVMRGDRFARRVKAFASATPDAISFQPNATFQLVPGAYNRVAARYSPRSMGARRVHFNVVDVDSRELVASWIVTCTAAAPAVLRTYEVDIPPGRSLMKKIVFKNPWDVPRRYLLSSSNTSIMEPRDAMMDVPPNGSTYLRLRFTALPTMGNATSEVFLFLNDESGQNEESYLFRCREGAAEY